MDNKKGKWYVSDTLAVFHAVLTCPLPLETGFGGHASLHRSFSSTCSCNLSPLLVVYSSALIQVFYRYLCLPLWDFVTRNKMCCFELFWEIFVSTEVLEKPYWDTGAPADILSLKQAVPGQSMVGSQPHLKANLFSPYLQDKSQTAEAGRVASAYLEPWILL